MSATQTPLQTKPKTKVVGKSTTTLVDNKKRAEVKVKVRKPVVVFYIGGAGDKRPFVPGPPSVVGPFRNVRDAMAHVEKRIENERNLKLVTNSWLGYYEIYGEEKIKKNILQMIPSKTTPVFIIGHSLGAWNGAHLSGALSKAGYHVEMLVTIDPVGEGAFISMADIYTNTPKPVAKMWINILANPENDNGSDVIADLGERWIIKAGPNLNCELDVNHADAGIMFNRKISGDKTAADLVADAIKRLTK